MDKLKRFFIILGIIALSFLSGVVTFLFIKQKPGGENIVTEAEKAKKDMEEYIEKTDSHMLVADSPNSAEHYSRVEDLKQDFLGRLRDRLREKL